MDLLAVGPVPEPLWDLLTYHGACMIPPGPMRSTEHLQMQLKLVLLALLTRDYDPKGGSDNPGLACSKNSADHGPLGWLITTLWGLRKPRSVVHARNEYSSSWLIYI